MTSSVLDQSRPNTVFTKTPTPIVALDVPAAEAALSLVDKLPGANFFKVGLQLFSAVGPDIVRELVGRGHRVFLDLKLHDIPNTVAGAVRSVGSLKVDLLTVHASGGLAMIRAAVMAAEESPHGPRILCVTALTSLRSDELAFVWGRGALVMADEAVRLARISDEAGAYGIVSSLKEVEAVRSRTRKDLPILTPGIRLPGDPAGDQARTGTPTEAAALGVNYVVIGRTVTSAPDPGEAYVRVVEQLRASATSEGTS